MKCLGERCYYYHNSNGTEICDLVLDDFITDNTCIGYRQIEKEINNAMLDISSAVRKYDKLQRLKARIDELIE